nr:MAG TPA: hypothetical protein [Caudoviricetes sp.]
MVESLVYGYIVSIEWECCNMYRIIIIRSNYRPN